MAISKEKKKGIVENLKKVFKDAGSVVFLNFKGVGVNDTNAFRKELRDKKVGYTVAKKTLIKKALEDAKFEGEAPELTGEVAIAYSENNLDSSREIYALEKKLDKKLSIIGGVFEKLFKGREDMVELASIPPQETLRGMFVNVINSPIQGLVIALSEIGKKK